MKWSRVMVMVMVWTWTEWISFLISKEKEKGPCGWRRASGWWWIQNMLVCEVVVQGRHYGNILAPPWQVRWKVSKVPWWGTLLCPVGWRGGTYKVHFQDCSKMAANWEQDTLLHVYSFQNRKNYFSFSPSFAPGVSSTFADSLRMGIALKHIPRVGRFFFFFCD